MNKTVKTIAWICLVLGLLGVAVDVGVYVRGRAIAAQVDEWIGTGEMPGIGRRFDSTDSDERIKPEELGSWDMRPFGGTFPGGMRGGRMLPQRVPGGYGFSQFGFGAPMLLLAAGPILAVVGGVILIVNREPLESDNKKKKVKKQKE